ncbi:MAG: ShlB/FhaC/HecB family hemolysin secretion/activation protein [Rhodocyclaceae bacterium]|nr:ShlB/FhaC/HecB family hemolysin secretion/activation protein [Rhodocyclaceae bacterium]MDZ4214649.1 ShlB/FhaC/HecB family hemolysin secretion/activation protein [Rhodocyclaceae bacterium]
MHNPSSSLLAVALVLATASLGVHAQTPPDAGALQQQIERERQQQMPKRIAPEKPAAPAAMQPAAGVAITVKQFRFTGNTLISAEQLAPVVANFLNRPLDFAQLQAAAAAVGEVYRAAGWVVNAYLPQQDIKDGIVTIHIIEAVFGKLKTEGVPSKRVASARIEAIFAAQQASGTSLNADALDRGLLLADDLPGIAVAGSLAAGSRDGETDLILKMADEPWVIGEVAIDNTGARSTGADRLTANINITSPLGIGDLLSANAIHTRGSDYLRIGYTLPVGSDGWRVGLNASGLRYKLITLNPDQDKGTSSVVGLEASYPLIRSRLANLYLNLNADHKKFDNQFGGATSSRYNIDSTSIALNGNLFDNWGGGGANSGSLTWTGGSRDNEVGTTNQRFSKLRYSLSRQQVISNDLSFFAQGSGQDSGDKLDSSEKFYLGGAGGVRAYPSSEGGGDSGVLGNLELRWKLPEGFILTGFHDYGHVRNNDGAMSYSLQGYGLSLGWQTPVGVNLKATWAHRLGKNPNPTVTGRDQDGSLDKNRLWLSASLPF